MGNGWGNPCISNIMKYTIWCESNGKRAPLLWGKYEYQFPRFSTCDGFCRIFLSTNFAGFSHSMTFTPFSNAFWKLMGKPMHSPYDKVYLRIWEYNEKNHPFYRKSMGTNFPDFPDSMNFAVFSNALWNWRENPCISHVMQYTIRRKSNRKKAPTLWEKYGN